MDSSDNKEWEKLVKDKHKAIVATLDGLSVSQSKFILDIVIEDIVSNAIVQSDQLSVAV